MSGPEEVSGEVYAAPKFGSWAGLDRNTRTAAVAIALGELSLLPVAQALGPQLAVPGWLFVGVVLGAAATQLAALSYWLSFGRDTPTERALAAGLWSAALVSVCFLGLGPLVGAPGSSSITRSLPWLSAFMTAVACAAVAGWLVSGAIGRAVRVRLVALDEPVELCAPLAQFGIRHILLVTTVIAVLLALCRLTVALGWRGFGRDSWLMVWLTATVIVGSWGWMGFVLGTGRYVAGALLVVALLASATTIGTVVAIARPQALFEAKLLLAALTITVAALSTLQVSPLWLAGYRLQRVTGPAA